MPEGRGQDQGGEHNLDWRDYFALFVALLQTVALPVLVLIFVILAALVLLRLLR